jgi:hypothetical protein
MARGAYWGPTLWPAQNMVTPAPILRVKYGQARAYGPHGLRAAKSVQAARHTGQGGRHHAAIIRVAQLRVMSGALAFFASVFRIILCAAPLGARRFLSPSLQIALPSRHVSTGTPR